MFGWQGGARAQPGESGKHHQPQNAAKKAERAEPPPQHMAARHCSLLTGTKVTRLEQEETLVGSTVRNGMDMGNPC